MSNNKDFVIEKKTLIKYTGSDSAVVIPDGVTKISPRLFNQNKNIVSVIVPEGVKEIGFRTFAFCENLKEVTFPKSLMSIANDAFCFCRNLRHVEFKNGITNIGNQAFQACSGLETVSIPDSVTEIGSGAFATCSNLKKVHLSENLVKIGDGAFSGCSELSEINIPKSLTEIGRGAFSGLAVPFVIINNQLHSCSGSNKKILIPPDVETIKTSAIFEMDLDKITIPESVKFIEDGAITRFGGGLRICCTNEQWNLLWNSISKFFPEDKIDFCICYLRSTSSVSDECKKILNYIGREQNIIIRTLIESNDAECLAKILSVIKTPSVTALEEYLETIKNSPEITGILLDYKNSKYSSEKIKKVKTDKTEKSLGIKERAVSEWKELFNFKVIDGEITIKGYKGTEPIVEVPEFIGKNHVTAIDEAAFSKENKAYKNERKNFFANELTAVILPQSIKTIGAYAFSYCQNLVEVTLPSELKKIENGTFCGCIKLQSIQLASTVSSIGKWAFKGCEEITEIKIPTKIKKIQQGTFSGCKNLKHINIPNGVKNIEGYAFFNCRSLKEIALPSKLENVDTTTFSSCPNLADENGFVIIANILYNYYGEKTEITIPQSVIAIADEAFKNDSTIKNITIPEGVLVIADSAFEKCVELESVNIPDSLAHIGNYAFSECPKLKITTPVGKRIVSFNGRYAIKNID